MVRGSCVSQARLEDRQLANVDNAPVIEETFSCEFSDVGIENDSRAVKLLFLRSVAPLMSSGKEEKAKGEEKVNISISSFFHLPFGFKRMISKLHIYLVQGGVNEFVTHIMKRQFGS